MEIKKPENYQPGGQEALTEGFKSNILQILFILLIGVWLISAVFISIGDIFNGFQHSVLTTTFISSIVVGSYLKIRQVMRTKKLFPGITKSEGCSKCGKGKSK